jgi:putative ABC transport system permease protein
MMVLRRLGLRKRDIWSLFLTEGLVYGTLASLFGTLLGLGISRLIFSAIGGAISINQRGLDQYFVFHESSLLAAFFFGLIGVLVTVALVAWRVGAWNQTRPSGPKGNPSKVMIASLVGILIGSILTTFGYLSQSISMFLVGISLIGLGIGVSLVKFIDRRLAWTLVGLTLLTIWVPGMVISGFSSGGLENLLAAGAFCVVAVSIIIVVNAPYVSRLFQRWDKDGVGHLSFTYIEKEWRKTFMGLFVFTTIVLTLTLSFTTSVMISEGVPSMMRDATGGLDVICLTDPERPIEPDLRTSLEGGSLHNENISTVVPLYCSQVGMMGEERSYNLIGFGTDLLRYTNYPLNEYDEQTYGDQEEVWQSVAADPHLAIVDGGLARDLVKAVVGDETSGVALGSTIELNVSAGQVVQLTVVGVMEQRTFSGIFINASLAKEAMALRAPNVFMISFSPGLDRGEQVQLLERELIYNGVMVIDVEAEAEHWQQVMDDVLLIFQSFLALTLVTGICALTIGRLRAIHDRRRDLRVLRAIGMNGKMLVRGQLIEASFVAIAGTVMGCVLGILVVMSIWAMTFKEAGVPLEVPYWSIAIMAVVTLGVTMGTVVPVCMSARKVACEEEKQIL